MADGGAFILDHALAGRIRERAEAEGITPEALLSEAVEWFIGEDNDPFENEADEPHLLSDEEHDQIAEDTLRNGDGIPWAEFRPRLLGMGRSKVEAAD